MDAARLDVADVQVAVTEDRTETPADVTDERAERPSAAHPRGLGSTVTGGGPAGRSTSVRTSMTGPLTAGRAAFPAEAGCVPDGLRTGEAVTGGTATGEAATGERAAGLADSGRADADGEVDRGPERSPAAAMTRTCV